MASKLMLDTADPDAADVVGGWKEGGKYQITLNVTMGPTSGSMTEFTVDGISDYGEGGMEEESEVEMEGEETESAPPKSKAGNGNPALMILVGRSRGKAGG